MTWQYDQEATMAARRAFARTDFAPKVCSNGAGVYLIQPTPLGTVELARCNDSHAFVAAAKHPPPTSAAIPNLPPELRDHFLQNHLKPWRLIPKSNVCDAIRCLLIDEHVDDDEDEILPVKWMRRLDRNSSLIGDDRLACCRQVAALLSIESGAGPLAYLEGIDGIGRKTLAAAVAGQCGWRLRGELPLARLLIRRVLETRAEGCLQALVDLADRLAPEDLIVVSDAECLRMLPVRTGALLMRELAHLPHVLLIARPAVGRPLPVVELQMPGMHAACDVRELITSEYDDVRFVGSAYDLLVRAATVPNLGVIPGRVRVLMQVARSYGDGLQGPLTEQLEQSDDSDGARRREEGSCELSPDDVVAATSLLRPGFDAQLEWNR